MRKISVITASVALALIGTLFGLTAQRPGAQAAPPTKPTLPPLPPAGGSMTDLLSGKLYPTTIKRDELAPTYHFVTIIDAQGNPALCATKGDMQTFGGETFLVAYRLPDAPARPAAATDPAPPLPDARLILVNMHSIEAIGGIRDTEAPPAPTPAPGTAAPTPGMTAPAGTP